MRLHGNRLDLSGQRYGKLTVLSQADNIGNKTAWLCRCDCGNNVIVKTRHLRSGHVKSCGCEHAKGINSRLNYIDGTCVEMLQAKTIRKNNTSGVSGVDWLKNRRRWRASICFKGKRYFLGSFVEFDQAVAARKAAETMLHDDFLQQYGANNHQRKEVCTMSQAIPPN